MWILQQLSSRFWGGESSLSKMNSSFNTMDVFGSYLYRSIGVTWVQFVVWFKRLCLFFWSSLIQLDNKRRWKEKKQQSFIPTFIRQTTPKGEKKILSSQSDWLEADPVLFPVLWQKIRAQQHFLSSFDKKYLRQKHYDGLPGISTHFRIFVWINTTHSIIRTVFFFIILFGVIKTAAKKRAYESTSTATI